MQGFRTRLTFANVCSFLALVIALGTGGAYAANTVFSTDIVDGEVKTADLANNSVRTGKILNGQVTSADLAPPEGWQAVRAGSATGDRCASATATAVFCSDLFEPTSTFMPWHNFGGEYSRAAFYRDQLGIVHLKGVVDSDFANLSGGVTRPIFRLPTAYHPDFRRVFASVGQEFVHEQEVARARVDVLANGVVQLVTDCSQQDDCSGSGGHLTLDGIAFRADE
jgi:hypothetical protein